MKIAIAGYSGFIGSSFIRKYSSYEFIQLSRNDLNAGAEYLAGKIDGSDVVLSLTGYPIIKRWTRGNRRRIMESRAGVNQKLTEAIRIIPENSPFVISASAIGIYSEKGIHDEESKDYGEGFMAEVVKNWESSLEVLQNNSGIAFLRIGLVLGKNGGAFPRLLRLTRMGLGAIIGKGNQPYSYIHIDDLIRAIDFIIQNKITGPVNTVGPQPVTQAEFMKSLGGATGKIIWMRVPAFAVHLLLGGAANTLTSGQHVLPSKLLKEEFEFKFARLEAAFENLLS
jgi:uncharacterized protein (TIGR01777 family)